MTKEAKKLGEIKPEPVIKLATQADFIRMFYLILDQNGIRWDGKEDTLADSKTMEIDIRALQNIPANAKICGEIENGMLKVWLPDKTRQQKRKEEREKSKLILPDNRLIVPL